MLLREEGHGSHARRGGQVRVEIHIPNADTAGFEQCVALFKLVDAVAHRAADIAGVGDGYVSSWELDALASRKAPTPIDYAAAWDIP